MTRARGSYRVKAYTPPVHYSPAELEAARIADELNDAECAERQAAEGPFFPERGITAESLRAYAAKCRARASAEPESLEAELRGRTEFPK